MGLPSEGMLHKDRLRVLGAREGSRVEIWISKVGVLLFGIFTLACVLGCVGFALDTAQAIPVRVIAGLGIVLFPATYAFLVKEGRKGNQG